MESGKRLAHYEIGDLIGKGGMGEVWRARDTKLSREVALKILPPEFAHDGERLARFEREAKVLASLHHPNIASIFGFETTPECTFLVMELVEGEDLAQVLKRGPLPVDEAVEIARQIAEGLEEAHEKGVVHRDLKPANVKRAPDGKVKVLDFGLARAYAGQTAGEEVISSAPTMTAAMTQVGTVLGTAAYMSPEQARGKEVDRRADIWAFGVILFEMLTGRQTFVGETASDTLAGILKSDPEWERLPDGLPPQVERVLRRCLAKDPRQRLRDIGEARVRLENPAAESGVFSGQMAAVGEPAGARLRLVPWVVAALAVAAAVFLGLRGGGADEPGAERIRYRFDVTYPSRAGSIAVSPDGRRYAYVDELDGERVVWVRAFDEPEGRPLKAARSDDGNVYWTHDGAGVVYLTADTIERISVDGGSPQTICRVPGGWRVVDLAPDGSLLLEVMLNAENAGWYLWRPGDDQPQRFERPLALESGQTRAWLVFLPDGEHYLFTHIIKGERQAVLSRLGDDATQVLFPTDTCVMVADNGWYVFSRRGQLLAQAFDRQTFLPVGETVVLAESVALFTPNGRLSASVSDEGTIVYETYGDDREVRWYDGEGRLLGPVVERGDYREAVLSPDGRQVALGINDKRSGTGDLWLHDIERGLTSRLTDTPWAEFSPEWSPDGTQLVYSADATGPPNLFILDVDGGQPRELVPMNQTVQYPSDWTVTGDIVYMQSSGSRGMDLWTVPAAGGEPASLVATEYSEGLGVVSPDGRWLAYWSTRTGTAEVYVQPYGRDGVAQRVSVDTGAQPRWQGKDRLFYREKSKSLVAVDLAEQGDRLRIGRPQPVLELPDGAIEDYSLHPDGRILVMVDVGSTETRTSHVLVGWGRSAAPQ